MADEATEHHKESPFTEDVAVVKKEAIPKISVYSRSAMNVTSIINMHMKISSTNANMCRGLPKDEPETPSTKSAKKESAPDWFKIPHRPSGDKERYMPIFEGRNLIATEAHPKDILQLPILNREEKFPLLDGDIVMVGVTFTVREKDWNLMPAWILLCKRDESSNDEGLEEHGELFEEGF
ncbi:hypothetical protein BC829DRAFT_447264 [Chytridium lagenaria]|nr:hypothetical protein BC829DRAFT_447264 [Chytridium lagenaria]